MDRARDLVERPDLTEAVSPSSAPLMRMEDLSKSYGGGVVANDGISLTIRPGEVFGLLGPNGAGKTTLVSQVIGLLKPDAGRIELDGIDLVADPGAGRRMCSYLPQAQLPIDPLPVGRAVELVGRIRGGPAERVRARRDALIGSLELDEWRGELGNRVSGGVKRLVGFMMAAVWPGRMVILDEPTNDVDPLRRRLLWREIRELAADGTAVLLVTHNVLEAERSVDRLAVIDQGRIVAEGTPAALKKGGRGRLHLNLTLEPGAEAPAPADFVRPVGRTGRRWLLHLDEGEATRALEWARGLRTAGRIEEYELGPTTLEDTYVRLIGRADTLERAET